MSASGRPKTIERYIFPTLIAVPLAVMSLSELWPYLGQREKIFALAEVPVLSDPLPLWQDKERTVKVIGKLREGDSLEVYRKIYGKDYLIFEVQFDGRRAYVPYDGRSIDRECRRNGEC